MLKITEEEVIFIKYNLNQAGLGKQLDLDQDGQSLQMLTTGHNHLLQHKGKIVMVLALLGKKTPKTKSPIPELRYVC